VERSGFLGEDDLSSPALLDDAVVGLQAGFTPAVTPRATDNANLTRPRRGGGPAGEDNLSLPALLNLPPADRVVDER
jgi:hypothetical protein